MSSESGSSSPRRARKDKEEERPRSFDTKAKSMCWANAETVPGRHPERWRKDAAGNVVCKRFFNCQGCLCFEYDHIVPFSKGGESVAENCQILQTRVNRLKSDKVEVDGSQLKNYSCDIKFTGFGSKSYQLKATSVVSWAQALGRAWLLPSFSTVGGALRALPRQGA